MTTVLELGDTTLEIISKMSEGNPGACTVLFKIFESHKYNAALIIFNLDSMEIRGCKIWIGFKDYCKQDLEAFCELILLRDGSMKDFINKEMNGINIE